MRHILRGTSSITYTINLVLIFPTLDMVSWYRSHILEFADDCNAWFYSWIMHIMHTNNASCIVYSQVNTMYLVNNKNFKKLTRSRITAASTSTKRWILGILLSNNLLESVQCGGGSRGCRLLSLSCVDASSQCTYWRNYHYHSNFIDSAWSLS